MTAAVALALWLAGEGLAAPTMSGWIQGEYVRGQESEAELDGGTREPLNVDRFLIRRARLKATGRNDHVEYAAELDFSTLAGPQVGLRQVEAALRYDGPTPTADPAAPALVRLGVGMFLVPFGRELYDETDRDRLFAERTLASRAYFPGEHDLGARLGGRLPWAPVSWVLAATNGQPLGTTAFPARDPDQHKDFVGRISVDDALTPWAALAGGVSVLRGTGFHAGTAATKDTIAWRDLNEDGLVQPAELQTLPGSAATPSQTFARWGVTADATLHLLVPHAGWSTFVAGASFAVNLDRAVRPADPIFLGRDQRSLGAFASCVQELGERFLAGARYDYYEPALDRTGLEGGAVVRRRERFHALSVVAAYRIGGRFGGAGARLSLEYDLRRDPLALDRAGRPADLRNDLFIARLQAVF